MDRLGLRIKLITPTIEEIKDVVRSYDAQYLSRF